MTEKQLRKISISLVFIGLTVSFLELKGWLPNPRLALAKKVMALGEKVLPFDTPYVKELILYFASTKYPKLNKNNLDSFLRDCDGIVIESFTYDGHDLVGSVRIQHKDAIKVEIICGFQDLKEWALKKQYTKWVGWILAFLGAILNLSILLIKGRGRVPNEGQSNK